MENFVQVKQLEDEELPGDSNSFVIFQVSDFEGKEFVDHGAFGKVIVTTLKEKQERVAAKIVDTKKGKENDVKREAKILQ